MSREGYGIRSTFTHHYTPWKHVRHFTTRRPSSDERRKLPRLYHKGAIDGLKRIGRSGLVTSSIHLNQTVKHRSHRRLLRRNGNAAVAY